MFLCSFSAFNCSALSMLWSHLLYISSIFAPPTTFLTLLWERFNLFGCLSFNCSCYCEFLTYEVNQPSFNCTKTNFRSNLNESAKRKFSVITSDWEILLGFYRNEKHALYTRAAQKMVYMVALLFDHAIQTPKMESYKAKLKLCLEVYHSNPESWKENKRNWANSLKSREGSKFSLHFFL